MLTQFCKRRVHYDLLGNTSAPVVCLVHAMMADGSMWSEQVPALLQAGFRVLRLDLPGHGGSEAGNEPSTLADLAANVVGLIDHLRIEKVHYCGLSIGGAIGQALAIKYSDRLTSLFLADTTAASAPNARDMWADRVKKVIADGSLAPLADPTMDRVVSPSFRGKNPVLWSGIRETIIGTQPLALTQCAAAITEFDFTSSLGSIDLPVLVVCGDGDPATPPGEGKKIASLIRGARYLEIRGARHYPNVEQAEAFNTALIDWLRSPKVSSGSRRG